jgi:hypothetical protein
LRGFGVIIEGMINIQNEGPANIWVDGPALETNGHDLDQEKILFLKEAEIALGKLEVKKLELENLGVDDEITKNEYTRLNDEIKKHEDLVVSLGGEKEVK